MSKKETTYGVLTMDLKTQRRLLEGMDLLLAEMSLAGMRRLEAVRTIAMILETRPFSPSDLCFLLAEAIVRVLEGRRENDKPVEK